MKNKIQLLLFFCLSNIVVFSQTFNELTQDEAWKIVKKEILMNETDNINVYVSSSVLLPNSKIQTIFTDEYSPNFPSWFFFIDDEPYQSWEHSCRYIFVDEKKGEYIIYNKQRPPKLDDMDVILTKQISQPRNNNLFSIKKNPCYTDEQRSSNEHKYAIIINGGVNSNSNYERYWNDCSAIYKTLIGVYGFKKNQIYVIMSDGTDPGSDMLLNNGLKISSPLDLDNDGNADIQYAATRANINSVFNNLNSSMTSEDNLFVFTMDHGGFLGNTHSILYLWGQEYLHDYEFASYINSSPAKTITICMGQCYSGGFIDDISRDCVVISTASRYNQQSYSHSNYLYDEYVYHWISAITGKTPEGDNVNADSNNDGFVSLFEAYTYAYNNDATSENPQLSSNPSRFAKLLNLSYISPLSISGSNVICGTTNYSTDAVPYGFGMNWSISNADFSISSSGNQCSVNYIPINPSYSSALLKANITRNGNSILTATKRVVMHGEDLFVEGEQLDEVTPSGVLSGFSFTIPNERGFTSARKIDLQSITDVEEHAIMDSLKKEKINTLILNLQPIEFGDIVINRLYPIDWDDDPEYGITEINGDANILLTSDRFDGMEISYTGDHLPVSYSHSGQDVLFRMPPASSVIDENGEYYVRLRATSQGGCHDFDLYFRVVPIDGEAYGDPEIYLGFNGSNLEVSFFNNDVLLPSGQIQTFPWYLNIYEVSSGTRVHASTNYSHYKTVNTSGWDSGIYLVGVTCRGNYYTKKFFIQ